MENEWIEKLIQIRTNLLKVADGKNVKKTDFKIISLKTLSEEQKSSLLEVIDEIDGLTYRLINEEYVFNLDCIAVHIRKFIGKKWADVKGQLKQYIIIYMDTIDSETGKCIVGFDNYDNCSIIGTYADDELVIDDNEIIFNNKVDIGANKNERFDKYI